VVCVHRSYVLVVAFSRQSYRLPPSSTARLTTLAVSVLDIVREDGCGRYLVTSSGVFNAYIYIIILLKPLALISNLRNRCDLSYNDSLHKFLLVDVASQKIIINENVVYPSTSLIPILINRVEKSSWDSMASCKGT